MHCCLPAQPAPACQPCCPFCSGGGGSGGSSSVARRILPEPRHARINMRVRRHAAQGLLAPFRVRCCGVKGRGPSRGSRRASRAPPPPLARALRVLARYWCGLHSVGRIGRAPPSSSLSHPLRSGPKPGRCSLSYRGTEAPLSPGASRPRVTGGAGRRTSPQDVSVQPDRYASCGRRPVLTRTDDLAGYQPYPTWVRPLRSLNDFEDESPGRDHVPSGRIVPGTDAVHFLGVRRSQWDGAELCSCGHAGDAAHAKAHEQRRIRSRRIVAGRE